MSIPIQNNVPDKRCTCKTKGFPEIKQAFGQKFEHLEKEILALRDQVTLDKKHRSAEKTFESYEEKFNQDFSRLTKRYYSMYKDFEGLKKQIEYLLKKYHDDQSVFVVKSELQVLQDHVRILCGEICQAKKCCAETDINLQRTNGIICDLKKEFDSLRNDIKKLDLIPDILERLDNLESSKKYVYERFEHFKEITEYLKLTKSDREECDFLFKTKAGRDELEGFVKLDLYKSVQENLSHGIIQILDDILRNELKWEENDKEVRSLISTKAENKEIGILMRCINCEVDRLKDRLFTVIKDHIAPTGIDNINLLNSLKDAIFASPCLVAQKTPKHIKSEVSICCKEDTQSLGKLGVCKTEVLSSSEVEIEGPKYDGPVMIGTDGGFYKADANQKSCENKDAEKQ